MRVALIVNSSGIGGTEKRYARLWRYLRNTRGLAVDLLLNHSLHVRLCDIGLLREGEAGVRVIGGRYAGRSAERKWNSPASFIREGASIALTHVQCRFAAPRREHYDVVHGVLGGVRYLGDFPEDVGKVFSFQDTTLESLRSGFYRAAFRRGYPANVASETLLRRLRDAGVPVRGRMYVDPCTFVDVPAEEVPEKEPWVVFAGRTSPEKNPLLFLEAAGKVCAIRSDARFFLLGKGPLDGEIDAFIARHRLAGSVSHTFEKKPLTILSRSLIYVSLQQFENYHSQALLEAMAAGNAVVATDVGETRRLVGEDTGILIAPESGELERAVLHLLDHRDEAARKGRTGRRRVMETHTVERYADFMIDIYREASRAR